MKPRKSLFYDRQLALPKPCSWVAVGYCVLLRPDLGGKQSPGHYLMLAALYAEGERYRSQAWMVESFGHEVLYACWLQGRVLRCTIFVFELPQPTWRTQARWSRVYQSTSGVIGLVGLREYPACGQPSSPKKKL